MAAKPESRLTRVSAVVVPAHYDRTTPEDSIVGTARDVRVGTQEPTVLAGFIRNYRRVLFGTTVLCSSSGVEGLSLTARRRARASCTRPYEATTCAGGPLCLGWSHDGDSDGYEAFWAVGSPGKGHGTRKRTRRTRGRTTTGT